MISGKRKDTSLLSIHTTPSSRNYTKLESLLEKFDQHTSITDGRLLVDGKYEQKVHDEMNHC